MAQQIFNMGFGVWVHSIYIMASTRIIICCVIVQHSSHRTKNNKILLIKKLRRSGVLDLSFYIVMIRLFDTFAVLTQVKTHTLIIIFCT